MIFSFFILSFQSAHDFLQAYSTDPTISVLYGARLPHEVTAFLLFHHNIGLNANPSHHFVLLHFLSSYFFFNQNQVQEII